MAVKALKKTGSFAALALALAAMTAPVMAQDADRGDRRGGWQRGGGESRGGGENRGGENRGGGWNGNGGRSAPAAQPAQAPQPQRGFAGIRARGDAANAAPPPAQNGWRNARGNGDGNRGWQGRGNADQAPRWGSQRPAAGEQRGRDWQNNGEVTRPAPARGAVGTPATGWQGRAGNRDRDDWQNRNRDRDDDRNGRDRRGWRDRDGDGRYTGRDVWTGNRDRDGRDGRYDRDRDGRNWRDNHHRRGDGWREHNGRRYRDWSHGWRNDHRYDWHGYRNSHRHVYRMGHYYAPYRNYSYRRLSIGFFLDSLFFSSRYWINDPWDYRLPAVYGPYRWIRYYDDALLVDTYTGEVVDVIHDFFW